MRLCHVVPLLLLGPVVLASASLAASTVAPTKMRRPDTFLQHNSPLFVHGLLKLEGTPEPGVAVPSARLAPATRIANPAQDFLFEVPPEFRSTQPSPASFRAARITPRRMISRMPILSPRRGTDEQFLRSTDSRFDYKMPVAKPDVDSVK